MPVFEIEIGGRRFEVEAPDQQTALAAMQPPQTATAEDRPRLMEFLNQGIAGGLGAPVDIVTAGINAGIGGVNWLSGSEIPTIDAPIGGSASIQRGMGAAGIDTAEGVAPEGLMEHMVAGVGGAAGGLGPVGAGARLARGAGPVADGVADAVVRPFVNAPIRSTASELAAGAGAGAGMDIAERVAPDVPGAELIGAILGGGVAGVGPYAAVEAARRLPVAGAAARFVQGEIAPFTDAGAMERARNRIGALTEDPAAAIEGLHAPTIGNLSPAVATGDRRLMALERAVRDTDPVADMHLRGNEAETADALREAIMAPAQGANSVVARDFMGGALQRDIEGIGQSLDATLGAPSGVDRVSRALRENSAPARRDAYDAAYEAPIDYSSDAGRALEGLLARVETAAPGTLALANRLMAGEGVESRQIMARMVDDGSVSFVQMPDTRQVDYITRALNQMARSGEGQGSFGGQTDIGRVMGGLSHQMRAALREANPAYRDALETAAPPARQRDALLLGQDLLDPSTPRDRAQAEIEGMGAAELAFVRQGVRSQLDEVLANVRSSMSTPDVGMGQAQQALRRLSAPAVREKIGLLLPEADAAALFSRLDEAAASLDPRRSGPALFANARPNDEIRAILSAPDPQSAVAQLVARAGQDSSGQAMAGLKGGVIDELMARSRTGNFGENGEALLSGRAMRRALEDNRFGAVAEGVLTPEERARLSRIVDELTRVETSQSRLPAVGDVMEGQPNSIVSMIARTFAARTGAQAGRGTSGASLLTAHFASQRMQRLLESLTLDKAEGLIRQAVTGDRKLFELLLTPAQNLTRQQESRVAQVLSRTAIGTAGGAAGASSEDDEMLEAIGP